MIPFPCDKRAFDSYAADERAADLAEPDDDRDWIIEREVFTRLCKHWFSAGPQPEEVLQRVFAATADRRPDLLRGLTRREIELAREESTRGRRWRIAALFPRSDAPREQYQAITRTLAAAFADARRPEIARVTFNEALCVGRDGTEPPEATETLSRVLEKLFANGSDPRAVAQRTFALTGWLFRDLQLNMSLDALGKLFAEERATQSWRSKVFVEAMLREAGCKGVNAGWQKPASAVRAYAESALGNTNRRSSRRFFSNPNQTMPNTPDDDEPTAEECQHSRDLLASAMDEDDRETWPHHNRPHIARIRAEHDLAPSEPLPFPRKEFPTQD